MEAASAGNGKRGFDDAASGCFNFLLSGFEVLAEKSHQCAAGGLRGLFSATEKAEHQTAVGAVAVVGAVIGKYPVECIAEERFGCF